jgi:shikimate kinase
MKNCIFLIGMPGTGKSTIGKRLAKSLKYPFVDLDERIVNNYHTNINTLFNQKGERFFRRIENITLLKIVNDTMSPILISCGGGTPAFYDNLGFMKKNGIIIHLNASLETLVKRLQQSNRPIFEQNLNKDELQSMIVKLLNQRTYYYQQADFSCPTDRINNQTISLLHQLILSKLEVANS